ncbi:amidohydrolase family protein [Arthrobacter celericrescens]|uniref:amidohydrolase family protein n=1 Tax=Arthrobacter celericrescens TaxID=2320851 RepID=UPI000EA0E697|nr:amidohydrolase family protein [Arthrobacter celericrescens]
MSPEPDVVAGLEGRVPQGLADAVSALPLVDHHMHGCFTEPLTRAGFEVAVNEGSPDPIPAFMTQFDSQVGFAIRRWCAPLLGLPPHAGAHEYWEARSALTPAELNRLFLADAGVAHWIVDTGLSATAVTTPEAITQDSGAPASEVLRLELLAEQVAARTASPADFAQDFRAALAAAAPGVVGFKTIAAYRCGFDIDWSVPSEQRLERAVARWTAGFGAAASLRLEDPEVISFIVHAAAEHLLPLQFHVGYGDRDLDLHRTNPLLLLPLLRQAAMRDTPVMLLHCYPYHREAGYLAQAFNNVYFDVGLGLNHVGSRSVAVAGEALELAPFAKQLYSSDAYGVPELHLLGSILWRRSMAQVLGGWVRRGEWSETDAIRVAGMIGAENARRVYRL